MRDLDDGPDGLNDKAFERMLRSSARRRVRKAVVIRCGEPVERKTVQAAYTPLADEADAWIAEMRAARETR